MNSFAFLKSSVNVMCDLAAWKFVAMLFVIDTTFGLTWLGLLWKGRKPAEAHGSCFPLCSPLLIDLRRFMLVMKWSRLIDKLWSVTNSLASRPLHLLCKAHFPQILNGWGRKTVLVFSCCSLWSFFYVLLSRHMLLGLKINSWQCFDKINMQYLVFKHCMHHIQIFRVVFKAWQSMGMQIKTALKKLQVFVKTFASGKLGKKITVLLSAGKQCLLTWERKMTEVVYCELLCYSI